MLLYFKYSKYFYTLNMQDIQCEGNTIMALQINPGR